MTDSAKEMGCRIHCRELLQKAVDDAAREVEAARKETADNKAKAETALEKAQAALARMKAPVSPTPLADLTGAPAWVLDLTIAILGSIGVNGLACCLLIFGAHHAHQRLVETARPEPIIDAKPADPPQRAKAPARDGITTHAAQFALDRLSPSGDGAELAAIWQDYRAWSATQPEQYSDAQIGLALAKLFDEAGIQIVEQDGRPMAVGVALKQRQDRVFSLS